MLKQQGLLSGQTGNLRGEDTKSDSEVSTLDS